MIKRALGLDWFDLAVHVGITGMVMIIVDSASHGPDSEGAIAAVVAVSLGLLAWRRSRALRQMPPQVTGEVQAERLALVEDRLAELEQMQTRMFELEERLDFTERMLAQQRDAGRLPAGGEAR
jgi:hypothetical protein